MTILFYYGSTINPLHGGIQRVTSFLGDYFQTKDIKVYYLSTRKTSDDHCEHQFYLPNKTEIFSQENESFFTGMISKNKIDIVINQAGTTPYRSEVVLWTRKTNAQLISVLHSSLYGMYGIAGHLENWGNLISKLRLTKFIDNILIYLFKVKYGKLYRQLIDKSDKVVLLSEKFIPEILYYTGTKYSDKIVVIPNPSTILTNSVSCFTEKKKEVLFVGRFSYSKRIDLLLKIWEKVFKKHVDWNLVLVGDGEKKNEMEILSKKMELENIYFKGYQSPEEYYKNASIFCMTSSFEGFGLVLVESMAYGIVPIAFDSYANVGDIIDDEENGFLIRPFSIEEYVEKLSYLIDNCEERNLMSKAAIKKSEEYNIENIAKLWFKLFNFEVSRNK